MMKSIGKTYLVTVENPKNEYIGNIYIPETSALRDIVPYIGRIYEYGAALTEEEKKKLLPIGTKIIMDYRKKSAENKIRLVMGENTYYVIDIKNVIAVIEED